MPPRINLKGLRGRLEGAYQKLLSLLEELKIAKEFYETAKKTTEVSEAPKPQMRFRLGDIEINDPNLAYRQGSTGLVSDFLNTGTVRSVDMGESHSSKGGKTRFSFSREFSNPMFQQGHLWYGIPELGLLAGYYLSDLLVTAEPLSVATKTSKAVNPLGVSGTFDVRGDRTFNNGRRVPMNESQLNSSNTSAYIWEPSYGYRIVRPNELSMQLPIQYPYQREFFEEKPTFEMEWHAPEMLPEMKAAPMGKRKPKAYNRQQAKRVEIPEDIEEVQTDPVLEHMGYTDSGKKPTFWDALDLRSKDELDKQFAIDPHAYVPRGEMPKFVAVDLDGNVDMRAVVLLKNKLYRRFPEARDYKNVTNNNPNDPKTNYYTTTIAKNADGSDITVTLPGYVRPDNLLDHIGKVVRTALDSPTPEGSTRQQFIESALFHDIGKVINSDVRSHGHTSVAMTDELGIPLDDLVRRAIDKHMDLDMWDNDPLTKGLHFADVARGIPFDKAAWQYPHLMYANKDMEFKPADMPFRDLLKIANKWLSALGYETIPLMYTEEAAKAELAKRMQLHSSFLRGVRDPLKDGFTDRINAEDRRNGQNAVLGAIEHYGESTPETRLLYSAEYFPEAPTGSGRTGLFGVKYRTPIVDGEALDRLPEYRHGPVSKGMGYNPQSKDALYASTSNDILDTYASTTDGRNAAGYIVRLPEVPFKDGESILEYIARNDFDMYDADGLSIGSDHIAPIGVWNQFVAPYLLQTGRSLRKDLMETYKDEMPQLEFELVLRPIKVNLGDKRFGTPYELAPLMIKALGEQSPYVIMNSEKSVLNPSIRKYFTPLEIDLGVPQDALPEDFPIYVNKLAPSFSNGVINSTMHGSKQLLDINTRMRLINEQMRTIDRKLFSLTKIDKGTPAYFQAFRRIGARDLRAQKESLNHELLLLMTLADKIVNKHPDTFMYRPTMTSLKALLQFLYDPLRVSEFMRSRGVTPRYLFPWVNDRVVIANDAPRKNVTKSGTPEAHHVEIVGDRGTKGFDIVDKVNVKQRRTFHRDEGERSPLPVTRKSLKKKGGKL